MERNQFRRQALELIRGGEAERGLELFVGTVSGAGVWKRSSATFRRMTLDNAMTLVGQVADQGHGVVQGHSAERRRRAFPYPGAAHRIDEQFQSPFRLAATDQFERLALAAPDALRSLSLADPGGDYAAEVYAHAGLPAPEEPLERNQFRRQA
ncbi:hypothetical protein ACV33T_30450, partial [Pseudomonas aeruginosa]